ncbi:MAG: sulfatase [Verrucomicrobiales bacterium]|nr:sulfatase [Verrucomicrobiales bacterium]|tara:strand:- start:7444 stop:8898 length:1455 start_codon:yes stop_codon:yes gene_type:complete
MNPLLNRRTFLSDSACGLSGIALASLLQESGLLGASPIRPKIDSGQPFAPRDTHFSGRAKNVLVIFCSGACSHVDTFEFKPELLKRHGQPMPGAEGLKTFQGDQGNLTRSPWEFHPRGQSGKMVSNLVPMLGDMADEMCFVHSLTGKTNTHGPGENFMSTGYTLDGFPSMGAWVTWALGSENSNLPAYVAIPDPRGTPQSSVNNWGPGFLPAAFQGTDFNATKPLRNLDRPVGVDAKTDRATRGFLQRLNERHLAHYPGDSQLAARISSYELAAKMQLSVPEVSDLSTEPQSIVKMYGADDATNPLKASFAKNCILARRLIEKGVRFVQLFNGAYQTGGEGVSNWDGHKKIVEQYSKHGPVLDQPAAALLRDLKQRGLLKDTLVVWCTEFGRMPTFQKGASGRDHNPDGFTGWLAGAGVKKGFSYGATDAFGWKAAENVSTIYDFHATILHLLGLDHKRLTYYHNGFERRLTDVHGHVIQDVLA